MTGEQVERVRRAIFARARFVDWDSMPAHRPRERGMTDDVNELIAAVRADEAAKYATLVKAANEGVVFIPYQRPEYRALYDALLSLDGTTDVRD